MLQNRRQLLILCSCSSLALLALGAAQTGDRTLSVSQALNIVFHSPAALSVISQFKRALLLNLSPFDYSGETLRIVNTSVSTGVRAATARTEVSH